MPPNVEVNYLAFDIETAPLNDNKVARRFGQALDPSTGYIVCIALKQRGSGTECKTLQDFQHEKEKEAELLRWFWNELKKRDWDKLVTWNGSKFDVPFLRVRSLLNGVPISCEIETSPYRRLVETNHVDLRELFAPPWSQFRYQFRYIKSIDQEWAAELLELSAGRAPIEGEQVGSAVSKGEWDKVKERCKRDVELTAQIFEKLESLLPWEPVPRATDRQQGLIRKNLEELLGTSIPEKLEQVIQKLSKSAASGLIDASQSVLGRQS